MWSFSLSQETSRRRQLEDWRHGGSASQSAPSQIPAHIELPVYSLQRSELLKVKDILSTHKNELFPGGLWPTLADQWCRVEAAVAAPVQGSQMPWTAFKVYYIPALAAVRLRNRSVLQRQVDRLLYQIQVDHVVRPFRRRS